MQIHLENGALPRGMFHASVVLSVRLRLGSRSKDRRRFTGAADATFVPVLHGRTQQMKGKL